MASKDRTAFLKLARDRFALAQKADKPQRDREREDLEFYAGEQWPADIRAARKGQMGGIGPGSEPPVPARPCITINKTREPVRQVLNQEREADIGVEIVSADDFGEVAEPIDETEIALREGLTRKIQRESVAADARTWAFARSTICGTGKYGVMTRYVPGKTNDKEIYVHRFWDQSSVLGDPARQQPDGSDAEFWFVGNDIPGEEYDARYKKRNGKTNRMASATKDEWREAQQAQPDWFTGEGEQRYYRVVDYWYTEWDSRTLVTLADGSVEWADDAPDDADIVDRREVVQKTIEWAQIDGCDDDVLDETDWEGPDMPIIEVVGEELQPYDKDRRIEGMVRSMREPGQGFNYMVTSWVERIGLAPLPPLMMPEGAQEGYEAWYQAANTRTIPYLLFKQKDLEGVPIMTPPFVLDRGLAQVIGPLAQSVAMFDAAIQSTSMVTNPALGQSDPSVKSAKHAQLLRQQSQTGTSNYLDNLQRSMRYEAQVINNLLFPIYGRPGRLARIINGEGEPETVILHQPYTLGAKGTPTPLPNQPALDPGERPQNLPQGAKHYTLTKDARFNIAIKITKSKDTRRQEEASIVGDLLSAEPQLMTWFGDLFFKNQDGPGHQEMADRAKVMLDPKILAMQQAKLQGQDIPPAVQAHLAQLTQQNQQMQQMLQQAQLEKQADSMKIQGQLQIEQLKLSTPDTTSMELAKLNNAAKIEIARITAAKEASNIAQEAAEERLSTGLQMQHETVQGGLERAHDVVTAAQAQSNAIQTQQQTAAADAQSQQSQQQADQQTQASDQSHQAGMQQQQQAAQQQAAEAAQQAQGPQGGQQP